ncbi:hypothetical protein DL96DRAFT_1599521 [Flagelloscypha sp. PMI_526]|nr:hypothetical protein DL96DRAFT_1599521 [Flagelloscypha sp. PMI_526]
MASSSSGTSSAPQLQLNIPESNSSTTSFKRSFEQMGLDLEEGSARTSSPKRPRPSGEQRNNNGPPQLPLINIDVHMGEGEGEEEEEELNDAPGEVPMLPPLSIHRSGDHSWDSTEDEFVLPPPSSTGWTTQAAGLDISGPPQLPLPVTSSLEQLFSDIDMPFSSSSSTSGSHRRRTTSTSSRPRIDLDLPGTSGSLYQELFFSPSSPMEESLQTNNNNHPDLRPLHVALPLHQRPTPQLPPLALDLDADRHVSSSLPSAGSWRRRPPRLPSLNFEQDRASFDSTTTASSTRPERFIPRIPSPEPPRRLSLDFEPQPRRHIEIDTDDSDFEEFDFHQYTERLRRNRQRRPPTPPPPAPIPTPVPAPQFRLPNPHSSNLVDEYAAELNRMRDHNELHSYLNRRSSSSSLSHVGDSFLSERPSSSLASGVGDMHSGPHRRFQSSRETSSIPTSAQHNLPLAADLYRTSLRVQNSIRESRNVFQERDDMLRRQEAVLRQESALRQRQQHRDTMQRTDEVFRRSREVMERSEQHINRVTEDLRQESVRPRETSTSSTRGRPRAHSPPLPPLPFSEGRRTSRLPRYSSSSTTMESATPDWSSILDRTGRAARERIDAYERAREAASGEPASGALPQGERMRARFARLSATRRRFRTGSLSGAMGDYELSRRMGAVKPKRGTPDEIMKKLEVLVFKDVKKAKTPCAKGKQKEEEKERCFICLDDYDDEDEILRIPECTHYSHKACLEQWLRDATTCPVCRHDIAPPQYPRTTSSGRPFIPEFNDFHSNRSQNTTGPVPMMTRHVPPPISLRRHRRAASQVEDVLNDQDEFDEDMSRLLNRINEAHERLRSPQSGTTSFFPDHPRRRDSNGIPTARGSGMPFRPSRNSTNWLEGWDFGGGGTGIGAGRPRSPSPPPPWAMGARQFQPRPNPPQRHRYPAPSSTPTAPLPRSSSRAAPSRDPLSDDPEEYLFLNHLL